jgi:hypothetical protein
MGVKLAAASGGSIELVPTNTASAFTVTVPASTGTMATTESTLTQFNVSGSAPVYACRAWVNFNGTGTVAIRASGNVSSITDNGTGNFSVNFTTAMPDINYVTLSSTNDYVTSLASATQVTTYAAIYNFNSTNGAALDAAVVMCAVFR